MVNSIKLVLLVAALGLTACGESFQGAFESHQEISIQQGDSKVVIPAGDYQADVNVSGNKENLKVKVELTTEHSSHNFKLKIPTELLPEDGEGQFVIHGSEIGQSFDILGSNEKTHSDSREFHRTENCHYNQQRCYPVRRADGSIVTVCRLHSERGLRPVTYFLRTYNEVTEARLINSGLTQDNPTLGTFSSSKSWTREIFTYVGYCH